MEDGSIRGHRTEARHVREVGKTWKKDPEGKVELGSGGAYL